MGMCIEGMKIKALFRTHNCGKVAFLYILISEARNFWAVSVFMKKKHYLELVIVARWHFRTSLFQRQETFEQSVCSWKKNYLELVIVARWHFCTSLFQRWETFEQSVCSSQVNLLPACYTTVHKLLAAEQPTKDSCHYYMAFFFTLSYCTCLSPSLASYTHANQNCKWFITLSN